MTVACRLYRDGYAAEGSLEPSGVSDVLQDPGTLVWLDISGPSEADVLMLREEFGFHELALEDSLHPHQRPKVDQYDRYFFLVAYGIQVVDGAAVEREMAAFVSERFLVTVRKDPALDLSEAVKRWDAHPDQVKEGGGFLLYVVLDEIVDGYFAAVDALEDLTEDVEEQILSAKVDRDATADIFRLKKELLGVRRAVAPLRDVLDVMQRRTIPVVTPDLEPYYRDVYDHVLRATDFIDNLRDIMSNALDAHLAAVSNRLNEVMKVLTSWAAIILVPTLIAGVYGMNFVHMPELKWRYGYAYAVGLMLLSGFALYRMFKRRRWL